MSPELTFLCKPFPWRGSPQGSDIRSCLKCPMLRTCCFPTPSHSTLARTHMPNTRSTHCCLSATSTVRDGRGRDHSVWRGCVSTQCCDPPRPQCAGTHSGTSRAVWTYNLRPTGTPQTCWDLVTYAHRVTLTDMTYKSA